MSTKCLFWALKARVGNPVRKLILINLADIANDNRQCWPSHVYLAERAECSRSSVIRHLEALEKDGLISIQQRTKDGIKTSNVYTLSDVSERHNDVSERHGGSVTVTQGGSVTVTHNTTTSLDTPNDTVVPRKRATPPTPFSEIVDLYHELLPQLPSVVMMSETRKTRMRVLHNDIMERDLASWRSYFSRVSESEFLMGRIPGKQWRADFDFLISNKAVTGVAEGKYFNA